MVVILIILVIESVLKQMMVIKVWLFKCVLPRHQLPVGQFVDYQAHCFTTPVT